MEISRIINIDRKDHNQKKQIRYLIGELAAVEIGDRRAESTRMMVVEIEELRTVAREKKMGDGEEIVIGGVFCESYPNGDDSDKEGDGSDRSCSMEAMEEA
ncbi:unnamed protein product [Lactuca virosa]|uniref:Uncharacterized protein n=1 Tax=Lactuca virosa TaxID=75947 RepID=A0AAU9PKN4_9ASTR|nr:unnamed protein product [Lactuca virosa]